MSSEQDKLEIYEREWRESVLKKLEALEMGQRELQKDVTELKLNSVRPGDLLLFKNEHKAEVDELKVRIGELEQDQAKLKGITIGVSTVVTILGWGVGLLVMWLSGRLN